MRVLCTGDRKWGDLALIWAALDDANPTVVIHGGARGADTMAGIAAEERGIPVEVYRADWTLHGTAAGMIRNRRMLAQGKPDVVLAFHPFINNSRGTRHMVTIAKLAGIPIRLYDGHGIEEF